MSEYISIKELCRITGLTRQAIYYRARKENWPLVRFKKGTRTVSGFEMETLPEWIKERWKQYEEQEKHLTENNQNKSENEKVFHFFREKEVQKILNQDRNTILIGKTGIGKSVTLTQLYLKLKHNPCVFFSEPPTPRALVEGILNAVNLKYDMSKSITHNVHTLLQAEVKDKIYLFIDNIEKATPSVIQIIDTLLTLQWLRIFLAGHINRKRKFNSTWYKCRVYMLKPVPTNLIREFIQKELPELPPGTVNMLTRASRGNPGEAQTLIDNARKGYFPEEDVTYFDFTPVIFILCTVFIAMRFIGYAYSSSEMYALGGTIGVVVWALFWVFRGYASGWWSNKKEKSS